MDDLLQEFIAETRETLETLSGEIVAWEAAPADRSRLDAIFRFVHTVKGSCGFLDLPRLQRLSHAAEDVLAQVRAGERTPDQKLVNAVLGIVDRIAELVEAIDAGNSLPDSGEDLLIAALEAGSDEVHQAAAVQARPASRSVRLSVNLLDRMMVGMSDMVLARNELARRLRESDCDPAIEASLERMSATVADMRDAVTRTRMQKLDALFSALPRVVRDTAAGLGKSVTLSIDGADVELDREMIEAMRDPLVHIIRNSIDHGIEAPADRRKAGKAENGRLTVAARQSGNQIIIEIADDGRGIDIEGVIRKLAENGTRSERDLRALPDRAKLALVFEPGLSTKDEVTDVSGRGVGMDVVRASVDQIGGRIELDNSPGKGLRIIVQLPLTLSIISAVTLGVGDQHFAIPRQSVEEIVSARAANIRIDQLGSATIATVRGRKLPLIRLGQLLEIDAGEGPVSGMLVIVNIGAGSYALAVDSVLDTEELVIKPAVPQVMASGVYGGQTLPDSGFPMLLLDGAGIAARANVRFGSNGVFADADADDDEADDADLGMPVLMFLDLDGERRSIPLAVVDRIEKAQADAIAMSAGRLRIAIDNAMVTVGVTGDLPATGPIALLRLNCGDGEIAYAVKEAFDIIHVRDEITPGEDGPIAGILLIDGEPVEMVDPNWLFDRFGRDGTAHDASPICLLAGGDDGWMRSFIKPLLEASGYRVVFKLKPGETPAVVLAREGETPEGMASAPLLHLRDRRSAGGEGGDGVFRYDRTALLSAVAERIAKAG